MKKILAVVILLVIIVSFSSSVFAYSDYYIKNYEINIVVNEDNTYDIEEVIDVYFEINKHGIFRTIPTSYSNQRAIIKNLSISEPFSTSKTLQDTTYKIGDKDIVLQGDKQYIIKYTYDMGEDNIPEFDQFYFNIIGSGWDTSIEHVDFTIQFPKDFDKDKIWLSTGEYGSTGSNQASYAKLGYKITGNSGMLFPYEALTIKVEFPEGYFVGERDNNDLSKTISMISWIACLGLIILLYLLWIKNGKDDKLYPTVQFSAPSGMTSAEVGYVIDGIVDNKDITSLIIYWADKGWLKIEELKKRKFRFTKIMLPVDGKKYELKMFSAFFALGDGIEVTTDDLEQNFYTELPSLKQLVKWEFKGEKELFSKNANSLSNISLLAVIIPIVALNALMFSGMLNMEFIFASVFASIFAIIFGVLFKKFYKKWHVMSKVAKISTLIFICFALGVASFAILLTLYVVRESYYQSIWSIWFILGETFRTILTLVSVYVLSGVMEKRTKYGHEQLEKLLGLKDFIKTAEMEKLKALSEENPAYFYNILPYAMVLGLDRTWAKKFESITIEAPNWYGGAYSRGFSSMLFYSHFNSCMSKTSSSMQMPKPTSTGSSMGGGGFSGGGGGGGGGGSW